MSIVDSRTFRRTSLFVAALIWHSATFAQAFPAVIDLAVPEATGLRFDCSAAMDSCGRIVSDAGDLNDDGYGDLLVTAWRSSVVSSNAGAVNVVFGSSSLPPVITAASLNGTNGLRINGAQANDSLGESITGKGDINGDGIQDIAMGAYGAPNGAGVGAVYVLFGSTSAFSSPMSVNALNGQNGLRVTGSASGTIGISASIGFSRNLIDSPVDDLVIAVRGMNATESGVYLMPGRTTAYAASEPASSFPKVVAPFGRNYTHVATGEDFNGDTIQDFVVGAEAPSARLNLVLGGAATYEIEGASGTGFSVVQAQASAGMGDWGSFDVVPDMNGDGIAELAVAEPFWDGGDAFTQDVGRVHVIFGFANMPAADFPLASLDGANGFTVIGTFVGGVLGRTVSAADVNGDLVSDLIVGAPFVDDRGDNSGAAYVVFGRRDGVFPASLSTSALNGANGFMIKAAAANHFLGLGLSGLGDVNGDGLKDFAVGAQGATPAGAYSGSTYVIFGREADLFSDGFE